MRVLVLGGTGEARQLAARLVDAGVEVTTSLAGAVQHPLLPAGAVRTGGFGGVGGLVEHLRSTVPDAVVDATHPFAATITQHAVAACADTSTRLLVLRRPGWTAVPGDRWTRVPSVADAARVVHASPPATVLLTTGRRDLAAFAADEVHAFVVRSVEAPTAPGPSRTIVVLARGPFGLADELALLRSHDVGLVVTKDSGGDGASAKLTAARRLGLPVVVVDRPPLPDGVDARPDVDAVVADLLA